MIMCRHKAGKLVFILTMLTSFVKPPSANRSNISRTTYLMRMVKVRIKSLEVDDDPCLYAKKRLGLASVLRG